MLMLGLTMQLKAPARWLNIAFNSFSFPFSVLRKFKIASLNVLQQFRDSFNLFVITVHVFRLLLNAHVSNMFRRGWRRSEWDKLNYQSFRRLSRFHFFCELKTRREKLALIEFANGWRTITAACWTRHVEIKVFNSKMAAKLLGLALRCKCQFK